MTRPVPTTVLHVAHTVATSANNLKRPHDMQTLMMNAALRPANKLSAVRCHGRQRATHVKASASIGADRPHVRHARLMCYTCFCASFGGVVICRDGAESAPPHCAHSAV